MALSRGLPGFSLEGIHDQSGLEAIRTADPAGSGPYCPSGGLSGYPGPWRLGGSAPLLESNSALPPLLRRS